MSYTIDASVFVSSARQPEVSHAVSVEFLDRVQKEQAPIFCPTLILAECSAAIAKPTGDVALAAHLVLLVKDCAGMHLIALSLARADHAATLAADQRLRGADSIYLATAEEFAATLITWDKEMLKRGPAVVATITPADWLKANPAPPTSTPGQP